MIGPNSSQRSPLKRLHLQLLVDAVVGGRGGEAHAGQAEGRSRRPDMLVACFITLARVRSSPQRFSTSHHAVGHCRSHRC